MLSVDLSANPMYITQNPTHAFIPPHMHRQPYRLHAAHDTAFVSAAMRRTDRQPQIDRVPTNLSFLYRRYSRVHAYTKATTGGGFCCPPSRYSRDCCVPPRIPHTPTLPQLLGNGIHCCFVFPPCSVPVSET